MKTVKMWAVAWLGEWDGKYNVDTATLSADRSAAIEKYKNADYRYETGCKNCRWEKDRKEGKVRTVRVEIREVTR